MLKGKSTGSGSSWRSVWEGKSGEPPTGRPMSRHSSHSSATLPQPAHTSDPLGAYKSRWGLQRSESKCFSFHQVHPSLTIAWFIGGLFHQEVRLQLLKMHTFFLAVVLGVTLVRIEEALVPWPLSGMTNLDLVSSPRCPPRAKSTASVPLTNPDVQQGSILGWTAVDAVKFVRSSSSRIAARRSHATTQRDWSATLEEELVLLGAFVEVHWLR